MCASHAQSAEPSTAQGTDSKGKTHTAVAHGWTEWPRIAARSGPRRTGGSLAGDLKIGFLTDSLCCHIRGTRTARASRTKAADGFPAPMNYGEGTETQGPWRAVQREITEWGVNHQMTIELFCIGATFNAEETLNNNKSLMKWWNKGFPFSQLNKAVHNDTCGCICICICLSLPVWLTLKHLLHKYMFFYYIMKISNLNILHIFPYPILLHSPGGAHQSRARTGRGVCEVSAHRDNASLSLSPNLVLEKGSQYNCSLPPCSNDLQESRSGMLFCSF